MARHSVRSEAVQALVQGFLIPFYLENRSVTATAKRLNDVLASEGDTRPIHVNRIQALLSDDVARGVNDLTLELVKKAAAILVHRGWAEDRDDTAFEFANIAEQAGPLLVQDGAEPEDIARTIGIPVAVLAAALGRRVPAPHKTSTRVLGNRPVSSPSATSDLRPDWSYQDTAVARCLDAFRRRPSGKVGLVLPTGAGKTRTALRIILEVLARAPSPTSRVVWVTHRHTLRTQAFRELNKLLAADPASLPPDVLKLATRIRFVMVGEIADLLNEDTRPALVVIDEAHHAAAKSYRPIFEAIAAFPVLLLTATPIRTDRLPIGIDEIAFTITYRELAERNAILRPQFETISVETFNWTDADLTNLVDLLINETMDRFTKTLVLVNRVDQLMRFHEAFQRRLSAEKDHSLTADDVGFIHGGGNSHGVSNEDFVDLFAGKPRALLISAQLLLEGFDDPAINAVVITYETNSVIKLMQAAGRCVRYAPGKRQAFVVQADNPDLAYRFDQRWLYQEIDDYLRPRLVDEDFAGPDDLRAKVQSLLQAHRVAAPQAAVAMRALNGLAPGEAPRLLFYGHPYFGDPGRFADEARWGVFVETPANSALFREVFNRFSLSGAKHSDPTEYLDTIGPELGLERDTRAGSLWRQFVELLTAAFWAREELYDTRGPAQAGRPGGRLSASSWLTYAAFHHRLDLPPALEAFLVDCHNRTTVANAYLTDRNDVAAVLKSDLPLGGSEAVPLDAPTVLALTAWLNDMRHELRSLDPTAQLAEYARLTATRPWPPLPFAHASRLDRLLSDTGRDRQLLVLTDRRKDVA
ncbi:DEAD/DEAH box helicase [Brevundimonas variabilis]|uniref:Superfamily II DNA or RNA helicase n=1 Tax=Brevundimonas variabilis TaxID=74312 RepID=A0A7W9CK35_9CAUL|nr:DEAD/DEAH box helicase family protein [Brevundimonas variabilis]MBB5747054.1 superfamily II DNA or RNA helicase [Brevundimonas variabilis]